MKFNSYWVHYLVDISSIATPMKNNFIVPINQISKSLVFILAGVALLQGGTAQAATFIDDFKNTNTTDLQLIKRGEGGTIAISEYTGTGTGLSNVLGGHRDLWLQNVTGTTSSRSVVASVINGVLTLDNGTNVKSWLNVTWDGNDSGANTGNPSSLGTPGTFADSATDLRKVIRNGLGGQDLTNGGLLNSIAVEVLSADQGIKIELTIYDNNQSGISTASYEFTSKVETPTIVYFPFTVAAAAMLNPSALRSAPFAKLSTAPSAANFTNVGAINMKLDATKNAAIDASIKLLEPADTAATVPEPSISFLAFSGLAAGLLTLKKSRG